jgi:hypothetical protein
VGTGLFRLVSIEASLGAAGTIARHLARRIADPVFGGFLGRLWVTLWARGFFLSFLSLSIIVCAVSCVHDAVAALGQRLASFGPIHRCICHLQSALTGLGTRGQSPLTGRVPFGLASRATCFFVTFVRDASGECVDRLAVGQTI